MKAENLDQTFRSNLKSIRESRGFSQRDLAGRAGAGQKTISELENGKCSPTLEMIKRLCSALEVDSDVLLTEDGAEIFLSATLDA